MVVQVNIPTLPEIIQRPRLEKLLERAVEKRLTMVTGSPGQGKTTLVASVLRRLPHSVFWYSLDPSNSRPDWFINDLSDFVQMLSKAPRAEVDSVLTGSVEGSSKACLDLLRKIQIDDGLVIVLDDFQNVDQSSELEDLIQSLMIDAPSDYHFIIISRFHPKWKLAQKTVQRKVRNISDDQLAFTAEEGREFFSNIYQMNLTTEQIDRIMALSEGWTPVMVMVGEMISDEHSSPEFTNIEAAFLFKKIPVLSLYLEQECFGRLTPKEQNVVMAASVAEEIPTDLANVLAGETGGAVIKDLVSANMLIRPVEGETGKFRFHSLWRSFLLQKAGELWGRNRIHDLHRNAGNYFFAHGIWKESICHFIHGHDVEKAIEVLKRSRPEILGYELADRLHSLILELPPEKKEYDPWVSFALACSARYRDPSLWRYYLQKALEGFRRVNDPLGESYALGQNTDILMYLGDFRQMQNLMADEAVRTDSEKASEPKILAQRNFYTAFYHCYLTGNLHEALRAGEEVRKMASIIRDDPLKMWACWILAMAHWFIGNFDAAQRRLSEAFGMMDPRYADDAALVDMPYIAGLNANFVGEFAAARSFLADSHRKAEELGMKAMIFYIKNFACYAALYLGDFDKCEILLDEMGDIIEVISLSGENDHILAYYWTWRGHYMYVRGRYHEAAALASQAIKLREKAGGEMYLIKCLLVLGGALREIGNHKESEHYLQEALSKSVATGSIFFQTACYLQLALLYDLLGNRPLVSENVDAFFDLAVEKSYYHFFMWKDDHVALIINQADDQGRYGPYIRELRRRRMELPDAVPEVNGQPIKVSVLGPLTVEINESRHENLGLKKPMYLLALLAAKSVPISVETIIDEMWPEMEINSARNNFYYTLNRLRNFLGEHSLVTLKDGFCSLNTDKIIVDIRQFTSLNERAVKSIDSNQVTVAIGLLKESIKLYRGNLLEGENLGPLLCIESESVEKQVYGSFVALGRLLLQTGEYEEALSIMSKATAISFADENLYRLLMLVYYALCNPGQALQIYNKLEKYFAAEFQTSPHRKTKELRDLIREGTDQSISCLIRWLSREDLS